MPVKKIDGVELYYEIEGEGAETVAFLNGIGMTVQAWQPDKIAEHTINFIDRH